MKKWTAALLGAILVLGITACGKEKAADGGEANGAANGSANQAVAETGTNAPAEAAVPTVDEMIQKATEASEKLKSFSMDAKVNQNIVIAQGDQKQEQKVDMTMKIDMVKDPLAMYQIMDMNMGEQGSQNVEQYITQEGIYSKMNGAWVKLPDETRDELLASMEQSASPEAQLKQFKSIANEAKVVEEGDEFVLSADLSGDGLKELAKSLMSQSGGENEQTAAMLEQMDIKNIKISYAVNKETFLPSKSTVAMAMNMDVEGQSVSLDMTMDSTISKYDEIDKIEIPQEALDSAQ
ncbi:hypothetical protein DFP94_103396 [Fontibacillus phaseoli]|uniref:Lipoprotein n=1 Tax=Fontibacillus phaseoli TaxID=1416533 RepID=A0A369BLU2_9BACL|nr:DUF6612 family protein [Fontibacillus phaseoli]RCX20664.1 hypothetical protein DFP94_103396 [Fontibacillus phaseoli]